MSNKYFAVFCGSAYKHIGVKLILNAVVDYLPSPADRREITVFVGKEEQKISTLTYSHPLALAFKIINDPFGRLTFLRSYAGEKITANSYIYNATKQKKERISRLVRMQADKREEIAEIGMGDIAAAIGFKYTTTGDTLCMEGQNILLEPINFAEPVISQAIEPKTKKDQDELSKALKSLTEEDPTFRYHYDSETGQMIISGMGELHLEVLVERLKSEFKVQVNVGKPEVAYRETIKNTVEAEGKYVKQSGGHGQYGIVYVRFTPNPEKGFEFVEDIRGNERGKEFAKSVEKGLLRALSRGLLLDYPVVDVKATFYDGKEHPVDSSDFAFEQAAWLTFHGEENKPKFQSALLEPIMDLEVSNIPSQHQGRVTASISSLRGIIENSEIKDNNYYLLKAKIPLAQTFGYSTRLRELTEGRATHSLRFSHYQEVPKSIMEALLKTKSIAK